MPITFDSILGNKEAKHFLSIMLKKSALGNSLLFSGPQGIGKQLFAQAIACHLLGTTPQAELKLTNGSHPDLHVYYPEGKIGMHSIQSMRELAEAVYQKPYEADYKVFIVHDAERMLSYSANALLKTFEEPLEQSVIILLSSAPEKLLPTILSRCRQLPFKLLQQEEVAAWLSAQGKSQEEALRLARLARGSIGLAARLIDGGTDESMSTLLQVLAAPKFTDYKQLMQTAADLARLVDAAKAKLEEECKAKLLAGWEGMTAAQKEGVEKEIEGVIAVKQLAEANALFDCVQSWYRDLELLRVQGNTAYLLNPGHEAALQKALSNKENIPLKEVEEVIRLAKLGLERSTSMQIVLEGLLLRLKFQ